ncbi:MAG: formyl transferase [Candidatus Marinimicrobia bacterium]|nr:formyl transferase [Candidatus Neomarinimicrobiota bacterium]
MKKIVLLSSDTTHHRYFLNSLVKKKISLETIFFETKHLRAPFKTGPLFEKDEENFEKLKFFNDLSIESFLTKIIEVEKINDKVLTDRLKEIKPDFGIVFGTSRIHTEVINLFPDGLINVHRGVAQEYRGLDSDLWAIYHRDYNNLGVTIHKVDATLDTGNIVYQEKLQLCKGMRTEQIRYYTTVIATKLVINAILDYLNNDLKYFPQEKKGRYYSFMPLNLKRIVNKRFNDYCDKII